MLIRLSCPQPSRRMHCILKLTAMRPVSYWMLLWCCSPLSNWRWTQSSGIQEGVLPVGKPAECWALTCNALLTWWTELVIQSVLRQMILYYPFADDVSGESFEAVIHSLTVVMFKSKNALYLRAGRAMLSAFLESTPVSLQCATECKAKKKTRSLLTSMRAKKQQFSWSSCFCHKQPCP